MNLPNFLTLLRIFFVPLLVAVLVQQDFRSDVALLDAYKDFWALTIFLVAAATDLLDGYLARRWKQTTTVGTLLDPIADKLLISAALISLVQIRRVPAWMVVVIVGREFAVTGLRSIAAAEGYTIKASDLGKTKMVLQVLAISLVMLEVHWPGLTGISSVMLWAVVVSGLVSAVDYFNKFWRKVDDQVKNRRRRELLIMERQQQRQIRRQQRELRRGQTAPAETSTTSPPAQ
jgi:CDP-diacylglycerol--glycerol-3-phosphate 3-phosphatidyltransferase